MIKKWPRGKHSRPREETREGLGTERSWSLGSLESLRRAVRLQPWGWEQAGGGRAAGANLSINKVEMNVSE